MCFNKKHLPSRDFLLSRTFINDSIQTYLAKLIHSLGKGKEQPKENIFQLMRNKCLFVICEWLFLAYVCNVWLCRPSNNKENPELRDSGGPHGDTAVWGHRCAHTWVWMVQRRKKVKSFTHLHSHSHDLIHREFNVHSVHSVGHFKIKWKKHLAFMI